MNSFIVLQRFFASATLGLESPRSIREYLVKLVFAIQGLKHKKKCPNIPGPEGMLSAEAESDLFL